MAAVAAAQGGGAQHSSDPGHSALTPLPSSSLRKVTLSALRGVRLHFVGSVHSSRPLAAARPHSDSKQCPTGACHRPARSQRQWEWRRKGRGNVLLLHNLAGRLLASNDGSEQQLPAARLALAVSREDPHAVEDIAQASFTQPSKLCSELVYRSPAPPRRPRCCMHQSDACIPPAVSRARHAHHRLATMLPHPAAPWLYCGRVIALRVHEGRRAGQGGWAGGAASASNPCGAKSDRSNQTTRGRIQLIS